VSSVDDCSNISYGLEIARIVIPACLVVIGWVVVNSMQRSGAKKQETRKDLRSRLDALEEDLRDLRGKCIEYYTDATKGPELSIPIRVTVEDVRRQTLLLKNHFFREIDQERVQDSLSAIMRSATGGSFESKSRKSLSSYDAQLTSLFYQSGTLLDTFEKKFLETYRPVK